MGQEKHQTGHLGSNFSWGKISHKQFYKGVAPFIESDEECGPWSPFCDSMRYVCSDCLLGRSAGQVCWQLRGKFDVRVTSSTIWLLLDTARRSCSSLIVVEHGGCIFHHYLHVLILDVADKNLADSPWVLGGWCIRWTTNDLSQCRRWLRRNWWR